MPACFKSMSQEATKHEGAAESRSTSAGSRESGERHGLNAASSKHLPAYEYPVRMVVRNTFIETYVGRPDSLEEFFEERRIHSSPMPVAGPVVPSEREEMGSDIQNIRTPELQHLQPLHHSIAAGAQFFMTSVAAATGFWTAPQYQPPPIMDNFVTQQHAPRVLMLSEALPGPAAFGSYDLPTVGSAGHHNGTCKPCAFLYTKGCENGVDCPFCHLCPVDEKRRRQKDKHAAFREMRKQRKQYRL